MKVRNSDLKHYIYGTFTDTSSQSSKNIANHIIYVHYPSFRTGVVY